jgi:hypothetical protein
VRFGLRETSITRDAPEPRAARPRSLRDLFAAWSPVLYEDAPAILGAWALIASLAALDWWWADRAGLNFTGWAEIGRALTFLGGVGVFYDVSGRNDRLANVGHYTTLWVSFSIVGCILTYLVVTFRMPLRDAQFAAIDASLGFNWWAWSHFLAAHRFLRLPLKLAYATFLPQIIGSVFWFSHVERDDRNSELLWTAMIALLMTALIAGLLPALGPEAPLEWKQVILGIRDKTTLSFALTNMQGIVTLPSFHTVMAILLIYAHRPPLRSFRFIVALNVLMLLSTPAEGHHYLVDMIAAAGVAALSIAIVRRFPRTRSHAFQPLLERVASAR